MCKKLIYLTSFALVLGLVLTSGANAADPSLVGWWMFDEGSGTATFDTSGNGNDGTLYGPQWAAGKMGGALQLDGAGDYVEVPDSPSLDITDAITIAVWVFRETPGGWERVVAKSDSASYDYWLQITAGGSVGGGFTDIGGATRHIDDTPGTFIPFNQWTHLAFVYDGTYAKGYINGQLDKSENVGSFKIRTSTIPLFFGRLASSYSFDGLIDDVLIYSRALTEQDIKRVMFVGGLPRGLAYDPSPENEATDVPRDVILSWEPGEFADKHDVYFGTDFDNVNNADRTTPLDVLVSQNQVPDSYSHSEVLKTGQTYYWRVDEVNAPPEYTLYKGSVWNFTVEPFAYSIAGELIMATASSSNSANEGPNNTINDSGLDPNDLHSNDNNAMWISSFLDPNAAWIQYEFDKAYKLYQMWVWNYNTSLEPAFGLGIKDVTIEYSTDGNDYTILDTTHEFARGLGTAGYAYNTTVDFGGVAVKYVRLTANNNWGGVMPQYGLSEVRFLYIPVWPREPNPASGATDIDVDLVLNWRTGREAAEHDVYISTDEQAVIDSNVPVSIVTEAQDGPISLDLVQTYYWKVNEVNEAEAITTWQGDVWNFSTREYLVVDDFELYNDITDGEEGSNLVYFTWIDGYENPSANGSTIGYVEAFQSSMETAIVHGGKQSVPLMYNNSVAAYSEATANVADLQLGQDWTKHGIKALTLMFFGDPNNAVQQMYVKVNGSKVTYDGDAENIKRTGCQMWYIDLASLSVNLSNVTELSIGFERIGAVGGQGVVYFDSIRLYSHDRQLITPVEPSAAGLAAHYEFESTTNDSSGNGLHGTAMGDPTFEAGKMGQAISLDGFNDYVEIPDSPSLDITDAITIAAWVFRESSGVWQRVVAKSDEADMDYWLQIGGDSIGGGFRDIEGTDRHIDDTPGISTIPLNQWTHLAFVYDGTFVKGYVNGQLDKSEDVGSLKIRTSTKPLWVGRLQNYYDFEGLVDDVLIYDRALSEGEVAGLAGITKSFDKPF